MIVPKSLRCGSNFLILRHVHVCGRDRLDSEEAAPSKHWSWRAPNSDHTIIDLLTDSILPQITFAMADSNTNAPITAAAVRPNRPMSEALLNEKVGIEHGILQEQEYRRRLCVWTRPEKRR